MTWIFCIFWIGRIICLLQVVVVQRGKASYGLLHEGRPGALHDAAAWLHFWHSCNCQQLVAIAAHLFLMCVCLPACHVSAVCLPARVPAVCLHPGWQLLTPAPAGRLGPPLLAARRLLLLLPALPLAVLPARLVTLRAPIVPAGYAHTATAILLHQAALGAFE